MSWDFFAYVDAILSPDTGLSASERVVAMAMARKGETCWASYSTLAGQTGLHRVSVIRVVTSLEKHGWITRSGQESRRTNIWRLLIPTSPLVAQGYQSLVTEGYQPGPTGSAGLPAGSTMLPEGSTGLPSIVAQGYPKESIERVHKESMKEFLPIMGPALEILSSIPGWSWDGMDPAKAEEWAAIKRVTPETAESVATAMKATLVYRNGLWEYVDRNGKNRRYGHLWATFQNWVKRPPLLADGGQGERQVVRKGSPLNSEAGKPTEYLKGWAVDRQ